MALADGIALPDLKDQAQANLATGGVEPNVTDDVCSDGQSMDTESSSVAIPSAQQSGTALIAGDQTADGASDAPAVVMAADDVKDMETEITIGSKSESPQTTNETEKDMDTSELPVAAQTDGCHDAGSCSQQMSDCFDSATTDSAESVLPSQFSCDFEVEQILECAFNNCVNDSVDDEGLSAEEKCASWLAASTELATSDKHSGYVGSCQLSPIDVNLQLDGLGDEQQRAQPQQQQHPPQAGQPHPQAHAVHPHAYQQMPHGPGSVGPSSHGPGSAGPSTHRPGSVGGSSYGGPPSVGSYSSMPPSPAMVMKTPPGTPRTPKTPPGSKSPTRGANMAHPLAGAMHMQQYAQYAHAHAGQRSTTPTPGAIRQPMHGMQTHSG